MESHAWNRTSFSASVPDMLPSLKSPKIPIPIDLGELPSNHDNLQQDLASYPPSSGKSSTEEEISVQDLILLYVILNRIPGAVADVRRHHDHFEIFYDIMPILNKRRFIAGWTGTPGDPSIDSLSYAMALVGLVSILDLCILNALPEPLISILGLRSLIHLPFCHAFFILYRILRSEPVANVLSTFQVPSRRSSQLTRRC